MGLVQKYVGRDGASARRHKLIYRASREIGRFLNQERRDASTPPLAVFGWGYVGAVSATCFAELATAL